MSLQPNWGGGNKEKNGNRGNDFTRNSGTNWNSPVSVLRFLQKLDQVAALQREVSSFFGLVGQLHPETTGIALQEESKTSNTARRKIPF